jgi:hypothetical protein
MQPLVDCEIDVCSSNKKIDFTYQNRGGRQYIVHLATPLRGIARGQICALYAVGGLICLGGGHIAQRGPVRQVIYPNPGKISSNGNYIANDRTVMDSDINNYTIWTNHSF